MENGYDPIAMTTILAIFLISLVFSLVLTPLAGKLGERFGALDVPDERKVHDKPIPRSGGIAIFIAFFATIYFAGFFSTNITNQLSLGRQTAFLLGGAIICFGVGVFDDFRRLGFKAKFVFQIVAASAVYWGGLDFGNTNIVGLVINFGPFSYFATVFWFVLLINSINLIDGLDGLAGGVVVFASLVMIVLSILKGSFVTAMFFAALGGGVLGFLRCNFNPATVLYIILPLADREKRFGSIAVAKDLFCSPLTPFTLRRIEQLSRTIISTLQKWEKEAAKRSKEKSISYMESSRDGYLLYTEII